MSPTVGLRVWVSSSGIGARRIPKVSIAVLLHPRALKGGAKKYVDPL